MADCFKIENNWCSTIHDSRISHLFILYRLNRDFIAYSDFKINPNPVLIFISNV